MSPNRECDTCNRIVKDHYFTSSIVHFFEDDENDCGMVLTANPDVVYCTHCWYGGPNWVQGGYRFLSYAEW